MMGGAGGPFQLPQADDQLKARKKKEARQKLKALVGARLPPDVPLDVVTIDVSEQQCGDPNCSPIDTIIRLLFTAGTHGVFAFPMPVEEVTEEELDMEIAPHDVIRQWARGEQADWPPPPEPGPTPTDELRFAVGARVLCRVGPASAPNGGWAAGEIVAHWYRMKMWPTGQYAPYQVKLDGGMLIFAPQDMDQCIRLEGSAPPADDPLGDDDMNEDDEEDVYDEEEEDMDGAQQ